MKVLIFNYLLTYKNGTSYGATQHDWAQKICLNWGQLQKLLLLALVPLWTPWDQKSVFFSHAYLPQHGYLLGTFSWSYSTCPTYIITLIVIAGFCCHFRVEILVPTIPSGETIEKYTQASDGDQSQLYGCWSTWNWGRCGNPALPPPEWI